MKRLVLDIIISSFYADSGPYAQSLQTYNMSHLKSLSLGQLQCSEPLLSLHLVGSSKVECLERYKGKRVLHQTEPQPVFLLHC